MIRCGVARPRACLPEKDRYMRGSFRPSLRPRTRPLYRRLSFAQSAFQFCTSGVQFHLHQTRLSARALSTSAHLLRVRPGKWITRSVHGDLSEKPEAVHVRSAHLFPPKKTNTYNNDVKRCVNAEFQAALLDHLRSASGGLSSAELGLVDWAEGFKNVRIPARLVGQAGATFYRKATAFEALVGYLHLSNPARLQQVLASLPDLKSVAVGSCPTSGSKDSQP